MRALLVGLTLAFGLCGQESTLVFAPNETTIHWTLGTLVHTVHGSFQLREGTVRFDRATGKAAGEIVVDALSGESGNSSRDSKMHSSVLESKKFPVVVFRPDHVNGQIPAQGAGKLDIHGTFELHGTGHEFTLPVEVEVQTGQIGVKSEFRVPYIQWGLKNPSTFILRVDDSVVIDLEAKGLARDGSK